MESSDLTGIDVAGIERELHEVWQKLGKESEEQGQALMRTCVLNLVAFAPGDPGGQETVGALSEVSQDHPSRLLLLLPEKDSPESSLRAMVTAQCHFAGARRQVCCEQIVLAARGEGMRGLASAVRPLLVPDLPVVLYWRYEAEFSPRIFLDLAEASDRVIVDSRRFRDSARGFANLRTAMDAVPDSSFSDLSWARINPWRRMVSGFFNIPDCRPWLQELNRVEIDCSRSLEGQTGLPVQALLMAAWLTSRLDWKSDQHFDWVSDDAFQLDLEGPKGRVIINVQIVEGRGGLEGVRLFSPAQGGVRFEVTVDEVGEHLNSHVVVGSQERNARMTRIRASTESYVIARELEILGRDRVFEQAAKRAAELAN